jgi:hypothetical protein
MMGWQGYTGFDWTSALFVIGPGRDTHLGAAWQPE